MEMNTIEDLNNVFPAAKEYIVSDRKALIDRFDEFGISDQSFYDIAFNNSTELPFKCYGHKTYICVKPWHEMFFGGADRNNFELLCLLVNNYMLLNQFETTDENGNKETSYLCCIDLPSMSLINIWELSGYFLVNLIGYDDGLDSSDSYERCIRTGFNLCKKYKSFFTKNNIFIPSKKEIKIFLKKIINSRRIDNLEDLYKLLFSSIHAYSFLTTIYGEFVLQKICDIYNCGHINSLEFANLVASKVSFPEIEPTEKNLKFFKAFLKVIGITTFKKIS